MLDDWHKFVDLLRSWGRTVKEVSGKEWRNGAYTGRNVTPWGRNNGLDWKFGSPQGWINHHFVCQLNPSQSYIDGIVQLLANGYGTGSGFLPPPVVPTFVDMHGIIYLISTGPSNHAGKGASSVVDRVRADKPPLGPAAKVGAVDDGVKNSTYGGTETQHPGDSTPYPQPLIDALVDVNAAAAIVWGWSDAGPRTIQHFESTSRKSDMSWHGGVNGTPGPDLRALVAARILLYRNPTPPSPPEEPLKLDAEDQAFIIEQIKLGATAAVKDVLHNQATYEVTWFDEAATNPKDGSNFIQGSFEEMSARGVRLTGACSTGHLLTSHLPTPPPVVPTRKPPTTTTKK